MLLLDVVVGSGIIVVVVTVVVVVVVVVSSGLQHTLYVRVLDVETASKKCLYVQNAI